MLKVFHSIDMSRGAPAKDMHARLPFTSKVIAAYNIKRVWTKYDGLGRTPLKRRIEAFRDQHGLGTGRGEIVCLDDEFRNDLHYGSIEGREHEWRIEERRLRASLHMAGEALPHARIGFWNIPTRRQLSEGRINDTLIPAQDILFPSFYDMWPDVNHEGSMRRWARDWMETGKPIIPYVGLHQPTGGDVRAVSAIEFMQIVRGATAARHEGRAIEGLCLWLPVETAIKRWRIWRSTLEADTDIGTALLMMIGLSSASRQENPPANPHQATPTASASRSVR